MTETLAIMDSKWKTCRHHTIGFVLCYDEATEKYAAYIGVGIGQEQKFDEVLISQWGAKLNLREARGIFPGHDFNSTNYKYI